MDLSMKSEEKIDLEDQFILRLPMRQADYIRNLLHTKPKKIKKKLQIDLDSESKQATVTVAHKTLNGKLRKLPTIIESLKTHNKSVFCKTADICQVLDCTQAAAGPQEMSHGLAPSLKNIKKKRFRKCLINRDETTVNVQKELFYLLQTDLQAVSTKFELIYEDEQPKCNFLKSANVNDDNNNNDKGEIELFGNVLTDSEETDDNIEEIEQLQ